MFADLIVMPKLQESIPSDVKIRDVLRVRLRFAEWEFEAEGPTEEVRSELAAFRKLLAAQGKAVVPEHESSQSKVDINKVVKVDGRVVSLTVQRESVEDAVLLLL